MAEKKSLFPPRLSGQEPNDGAGLPSPQYFVAAFALTGKIELKITIVNAIAEGRTLMEPTVNPVSHDNKVLETTWYPFGIHSPSRHCQRRLSDYRYEDNYIGIRLSFFE